MESEHLPFKPGLNFVERVDVQQLPGPWDSRFHKDVQLV